MDKTKHYTQEEKKLLIQANGGGLKILDGLGMVYAKPCKYGAKCKRQNTCKFIHSSNVDDISKIEEAAMKKVLLNMCPYELDNSTCPHGNECFLWHFNDTKEQITLRYHLKQQILKRNGKI